MSTFDFPAQRPGRSWLPRLRAAVAPRPIPRAVLAVGALVVIAAVVRFITINNQSLWMDEALTSYEAHLPFGAMIDTVSHIETTPPLYFVLVWAFAKVFGGGAVAIRLLSALAGIAFVPIAYLAGRDLVSRRAGLIAAALATVSPFLVWYSQEARSYMLLGALTGAAFLFFIRALRDPSRRNLIWWALFSSLAVMTHFFAAFVIAPEALWLAWMVRTRRVAIAIGVVAAAQLAMAPIALIDTGHGTGWIAGLPIVDRIGQVPLELGGSTLYRDSSTLQGFLGAGILILVISALLAFRGDRLTRNGARTAAVIAGAGFVIPLALAAVGQDYFLSRNLTPIWLPFVIVVAAACVVPRARFIGGALAVALIAASAVYTIKVQTDQTLQRPDWRAPARVIGAASSPRVIVAAGGLSTDPLKLYLPQVAWVQPQTRRILITEIDVLGARRREPVIATGHSYTLADGSPAPAAQGVAMPRSIAPKGTFLISRVKVANWVVARYGLLHPTSLDVVAVKKLAPRFFRRAPINLLVFFQRPGR